MTRTEQSVRLPTRGNLMWFTSELYIEIGIYDIFIKFTMIRYQYIDIIAIFSHWGEGLC